MIVTYDTEFLDDGKTIELISFGAVAEDGRTFYGVNADADYPRIIEHDRKHNDGWIAANVLSKLPTLFFGTDNFALDLNSTDVLTREALAIEVEHFLLDTPDPELWAYYSATDHVAGYQLFGSMIEASRDHGWPMRTSCLKQEEVQLERRMRQQFPPETFTNVWRGLQEQRPEQRPETEHHALHDAKHDMALAVWLGIAQRPGIRVDADPADVR
jgi:hypothetical protein